MKKVNTKRFQDKTPEDISFQGDSIPEKPVTTAKDFPLPIKETKTERTNVQPTERTNERSDENNDSSFKTTANNDDIVSENFYTVEIPAERVKIRHSFDIFEDQKTALKKTQLAKTDSGSKKKPVLGVMIQEAIDLYIKEKSRKLNNLKIIHRKPNERTNERTNENNNIS